MKCLCKTLSGSSTTILHLISIRFISGLTRVGKCNNLWVSINKLSNVYIEANGCNNKDIFSKYLKIDTNNNDSRIKDYFWNIILFHWINYHKKVFYYLLFSNHCISMLTTHLIMIHCIIALWFKVFVEQRKCWNTYYKLFKKNFMQNIQQI